MIEGYNTKENIILQSLSLATLARPQSTNYYASLALPVLCSKVQTLELQALGIGSIATAHRGTSYAKRSVLCARLTQPNQKPNQK